MRNRNNSLNAFAHWGAFLSLALLLSCTGQEKKQDQSSQPMSEVGSAVFDLDDIQQNGELIVLMLYGPGSYFEFRGEGFGVQYMLVNEYAKSIGCRIRVEMNRSPQEMIEKLEKGEGDIIATSINMTDSLRGKVAFCGNKELDSFLDGFAKKMGDSSIKTNGHTAWAVRKDAPILQQSLKEWIVENQFNFTDYATIRITGSDGKTYTPRRSVKSPILNLAKGQISTFDQYFKRYSRQCGWDWRLLAAQAYQESGFDPNTVSWMGAMGLMQLMPSTARSVGVGSGQVFDPECNIRGAARLIAQLNNHFAGIRDDYERINFVLAAYNAGPGHIDDARALARKEGKDPNRWLDNVDYYVLHLSKSAFYNQPEVKHGYFRGSETYEYVNKIRTRWDEYRTKVH